MGKNSNEIRVSGRNLEQALEKGATKLGLEKSKLDHRVISKTNGGIFAFLAKKVEIAVWPKDQKNDTRQTQMPRKKQEKNQTRTQQTRYKKQAHDQQTEFSRGEIEALEASLREFLAGICERMVGEPVTVESKLEDERLVLNIDSEHLASQIARNSKLAESFEHILRKKPRHLQRELPFRIFVDVKGVRTGRETELADLARDLSDKVSKNKRPIVLNYKSSYDRKIIHMTLDKDERVYTKSIGSGPNRKLMILPVKSKQPNASQNDAVTATSTIDS